MFHVYILKSINFPTTMYIGYSTNLKQRLIEHNNGKSIYTSKYRPWQLEACITFKEKSKAIAFEKYLKSGSGRAFSKKDF